MRGVDECPEYGPIWQSTSTVVISRDFEVSVKAGAFYSSQLCKMT